MSPAPKVIHVARPDREAPIRLPTSQVRPLCSAPIHPLHQYDDALGARALAHGSFRTPSPDPVYGVEIPLPVCRSRAPRLVAWYF